MENEPQFEGEEMKLPEEDISTDADDTQPQNSSGVVIFILFAILAAVLVGMYFWYEASTTIPQTTNEASRPTLEENKEPETTTATAQTESFNAMSTSDEITAIEADLESTDLDNLEAEMLQIEAELEAAN